MAMTPQLQSISALAVELDLDRRTVAAALRGVPPDGKIAGGHGGWYLRTALDALEAPQPRATGRDAIVETLLDRLENWREVYAKKPGRFEIVSLDQAAVILGRTPDDLLIWLRVGMPYVKLGDFETGAGFTVLLAWVIDWIGYVTRALNAAGDVATLRALHLRG